MTLNHDFGRIDGSLYLCLPNLAIPPSQPLSSNCSLFFSHPNARPSCQISYLFGPSLLKISYSLLLPGDVVDLSSIYSPSPSPSPSPSSSPQGLFQVSEPPPSLSPFVLSLSGPSSLLFSSTELNKRVCWGIRSMGSGGRGVEYTVRATEGELEGRMELEKVGWEGAGWGQVCVKEWGGIEEREYEFVVEGRSVLFGTVTTTSHSFTLTITSPSRSVSSTPRQISDPCTPSLWDTTPNIYGIQTYPSLLTILPSSLRSLPLTITTKALSPCESIGMSKDILLPFDFDWTFMDPIVDGLADVDPNDWAVAGGGLLNIPVDLLENRDAFPMNQPIGIQVVATYESNETNPVSFAAQTTIQFLPSPIIPMTSPPDLSTVVSPTSLLTIDLMDSYTSDGVTVGGEGGEGWEWEWEWEWDCFVPLETGRQQGGDVCQYVGGEVMEMPGRGEGMFVGGGQGRQFEVGVPMYFVVRMRVRQVGGGDIVAEGRWEETFSVIEGDDGLVIEESEWMCDEGGAVGYSIWIYSSDKIVEFSEISTLWAEDQRDFGELQLLEVDVQEDSNQLTQIECLCGTDCSEPLFLRFNVVIDGEEHILHHIYRPSGVLPPLSGDGCDSVVETYDGLTNETLSALSFVSLSCDESYFPGGVALQIVSFQSDYPDLVPFIQPPQMSYPQQLVLSCGRNIVSVQTIGFGVDHHVSPIPSTKIEYFYNVVSWDNDMLEELDEIEGIIDQAPNLLKTNLVYVLVLTPSLPCAPPLLEPAIDPEEVLEDILDTPVSGNPNDIITEVTLVTSVVAAINEEGGEISEQQQEEVIERLEEYLEVVQESGGTLDEVKVVGEAILETSSIILDNSISNETADEVYSLIEDLEAALLCVSICGEEAVILESGSITVGSAVDSLENIKIQEIGGATFELPDNIAELQEALGGEGACVFVGYSVIASEGGSPTASFTFYAPNCSSGTWEEISISTSGQFLITFPLPPPNINEDGCEEDILECVSGDTSSTLQNPDGCELFSKNETHLTCACTHLTAFSALFVDGGCAADWKFDALRIAAVSLLGFCGIVIVIALILEYHFIHKPEKNAFKKAMSAASVYDNDNKIV